MTNPAEPDPFTGLWMLCPERSMFSTAAPRSWIQRIQINGDEVSAREEIVRPDGGLLVVTVQARFDGSDYPVHGSPMGATIAYQRIDRSTISGVQKKNGVVTARETVTVSPDRRRLTQRFSMLNGDREVANGVAVFEKSGS